MMQNDSNQFLVNLNIYTGPLDVLLDLGKSQKVNLENISVTKLADQFHEFITKVKDLNLELASEYLLMATWLTYLKSKLLLPETDEEEFKALDKLNPEATFLSETSLSTVDDWIDTGCMVLNSIISGSLYKGIPKGRITGLAGPSMCGKTYIINKILGNAQSKGYIPVVFDTEMAVDD